MYYVACKEPVKRLFGTAKSFFRTAHAWMITLHLLQITVSVVIDKARGVLKSCKKKFDVS